MAAANFPHPVLDFTLSREGGWSDDPRDPGGPTMKGVTLATFRRFTRPDATAADLRAITDDEAARIYRTGYWDAVAADDLAAGLDLVAFDIAVNSGPARARAWLAACPAGSPADRIRWLCARRLSFWRALAGFAVYGRGWLKRGAACEALALQLAGVAASGLEAEAQAAARRRDGSIAAGGAGAVVAVPQAAGHGVLFWLVAGIAAIAVAAALFIALRQHLRAGALAEAAAAGAPPAPTAGVTP